LLEQLASHADIIVNRWKKKSRDKRQALLVETIPELYEHRWLLPRYCYMPESKLVGLGDRTWARRCQLLLHWLSLEALKMNPAVLFALLHNRTAYPPQDWATFDGRQLILSWACGYFDIEFSGQTWESGRVISVLPSSNAPGYYPGLFCTGRVRIWIIVGYFGYYPVLN